MAACSVTEMVLLVAMDDATVVWMLRVFRMTRALRMIHLLKFTVLRSLRLMLLAIFRSCGLLLWAVLLLLVIKYLFAIMFLQGLANYAGKADQNDPNMETMKTLFFSLPQALLTLFMSVTGGLSWWEVEHLLLSVHSSFGFIFILFVLVTMFAAFNIITGVFVSDAIGMARMDQDMKMQAAIEKNKQHMELFKALFSALDVDGNGEVSWQEFEKRMNDPDVKLLFAKVGLSVSDAINFFALLDVDGSTSLEIDEFVMGCMRFKNNVGTVDVECSIVETKQMLSKLMSRQKDIQRKVSSIELGFGSVHTRLRDLEHDEKTNERIIV